MDIIPIRAVRRKSFDVLNEEFFVDVIKAEALLFELFGNLVPTVEVGKGKPF